MASPPSLQEATASSTSIWQAELESLFHHAKDRFPDVVWQVGDVEEEVWGHKAIVYARAPPSFQLRYFQFRPNPSVNNFEPSTLSLGLPSLASRSPSPAPSPIPGGMLRLKTTINPALFANELEYLYTGQGFGEAFEFLFESPMLVDGESPPTEQDPSQLRIDKLRKDLVFMWRSRLYSDIKIALSGNFGGNHEDSTAIFSSHRFVLVSRCSYFHTALIAWPKSTSKESEPMTLTLPSPPFTPASLHFTLGFIYTGTLIFSHRTYDLTTAFHILLSATYLSLQSLYDEIQARIVQEMLHGLFHAFIEFSEYESLTQGRWGTGGCRCRQCARRAPRVLEFALRDDVKNRHLERGARRALVGLFGEGWCTQEFATLPPKLIESLIKGVGKRSTPGNCLPLLFASQAGLQKIARVVEPWGDVVRTALQKGRDGVEDALVQHAQQVFDSREWSDIMEADGVRFEDGERVELVVNSLLDAMKSKGNGKYAAFIYQALVSSILLRPHPTESNQAMLSSTSYIRVQVEQARMEVLAYLRKRWLNVKQDGGFDDMEGWALKEIADYIEVPLEELLMPTPAKPKLPVADDKMSVASRNVTPTKRSTAPSSASVHSLARSVISTATNATQKPDRPDSKLTPPAPSLSPSLASSLRKPPKRPIPPTPPDEDKMDVDQNEAENVEPEVDIEEHTTPSAPLPKTLVRTPPGMFSRKGPATGPGRPSSRTSLSPSVAARKTSGGKTPTGSRGLKPPPVPVARTDSRMSSVSTASQASTTDYKTATGGTRSRKTSAASVRSNLSTTTSASVKTNTSGNTVAGKKKALVSPVAKGRAEAAAARSRSSSMAKRPSSVTSSVAKRPSSVTSTFSVKSTTSTLSTAASVAKKAQGGVRKATSAAATGPSEFKVPPVPAVPKTATGATPNGSPRSNVIVLKGKARAEALANSEHKKDGSVASTSTTSSTKTTGTLKRKGSGDTITSKSKPRTKTTVATEKEKDRDSSGLPLSHLGATLDIGIPCIISSKRKRFKAFARYIGEVEGESGPWVGVEVPIPLGESSLSNVGFDGEGDTRVWHDGTWGGIKYFDIAGSSQSGGDNGSEWGDYGGYGDDSLRASSRRRWQNQTGSKGVKRAGDPLGFGSGRTKRIRSASPAVSDASMSGGGSETRGLFVRPAQVLYVVDADGDL